VAKKTHEVKAWPPYFESTVTGHKCFDLRLNDRAYKVGDFLLLREWDPDIQSYTGRNATAQISYILPGGQFGLAEDYVALSIEVVSITLG
jgi:hypothetical protein